MKDQKLSFTFSTGIIITILLQSFCVVWWASKLQAQTQQNTDAISSIQSQYNSSASVTLTRDQLNDILGSRDAQIKALQDSLDDFKKEVRISLSRVENKLK